jgi:hypothetical protein
MALIEPTKAGATPVADSSIKEKRTKGLRCEEASSWENFQSLVSRLEALKGELGQRLLVSTSRDDGRERLVFRIRSSWRWLARPAYSIRVIVGVGDSAFSLAEGDEDALFMSGLALAEVADAVRVYAAAELEMPRPYGCPTWLTRCRDLGNQAVAGIGFFGVWIFLGAYWGSWGILFGWFPAALIVLLLGIL